MVFWSLRNFGCIFVGIIAKILQMKALKLFSLFLLGFLFSECGTTEPGTATPTASVSEVRDVLDTTGAVFYRFANEEHGNPWRAIDRTVSYLTTQSAVDHAYALDSSLIKIVLKSGLTASFWFIATDAAGNALYRGGAPHDPTFYNTPSDGNHSLEPLANHDITNKKVLFFASDTKTLPEVKKQVDKWSTLLAKSDLGLEVVVKRDEECTDDVVSTFGNYGLVIIDTHGHNDGFKLGPTIVRPLLLGKDDEIKEKFTSASLSGLYDKITSGKIEFCNSVAADPTSIGWEKTRKDSGAYWLFCKSKFINALPQMPNTIIFGNMCYSGWIAPSIPIDKHVQYTLDAKKKLDSIVTPAHNEIIDGIGKAFIDRGLISYYGFTLDRPLAGSSRSVPDDFAGQMETVLLGRLVNSRDSTKIAHLDSVKGKEYFDPEHKDYQLYGELYMRHYGKDDYSYNGCTPFITDARDGQKYKTVCIGTQTWMAENLRYNAPGSIVYENYDVSRYGKLYDWPTTTGSKASSASPSGVQGICPKGWHVPSSDEWKTLAYTVSTHWMLAGQELKAKTDWDPKDLVGAYDKYGFAALPGGFFWTDSSYYIGGKIEADWWTSTVTVGSKEKDTYNTAFIGQGAALLYDGKSETSNYKDKKNCRCVKD